MSTIFCFKFESSNQLTDESGIPIDDLTRYTFTTKPTILLGFESLCIDVGNAQMTSFSAISHRFFVCKYNDCYFRILN